MTQPEPGRHLRRKLAVEEKNVKLNPDDRTVYELADDADKWLMTAIQHMYSSRPERLADARRCLIKGHGDLVRIAAMGGAK